MTFEELGVDRLFVDEAHAFKNGFLATKMRNVAGIATSESQKSTDMFLKCRYMDELTGGRGVIFCDGHARVQFHDRAVYDAALSAIWNAGKNGADSF